MPRLKRENPPHRSVEESWQEFIGLAGKEGPTFRSLLERLPRPVELENRLIFRLEEGYPLLTSAYGEKLRDLILKFFGKEAEFEIKEKKKDLEEVKSRPEVKDILDIFSAKISYIQPIKGE